MKKITFLTAIALFTTTTFVNATSISDALTAAASLENGAQTTERYSASGKVVYVNIDTTYGNADVVIEDGTDMLYAWRTFDLDSAKFTDANKIKVGDSITIYGFLKRYDALSLTAYPTYTNKIEMSYGYITQINGESGTGTGGATSYNYTFTIAEAYNYYDYLSTNTEDITIYLYNDASSDIYTQLDLLVAAGTGLGNVLPTGVYNINDGLTVGSAYIGDLDEESYPIGCWAFGEGDDDYWDMTSGTVTITKTGTTYTIVINALASDGTTINVTYTGFVNIAEGEFVGVDNVEAHLNVYTKNGNIIIPSEAGQKIAVYNMVGQEIYSTTAKSVETTISSISAGQMVIVRAGNKTAKVVL